MRSLGNECTGVTERWPLSHLCKKGCVLLTLPASRLWLFLLQFSALKRSRRRGQLISLIEDLPPRRDGRLQEVASEDPLPDTLMISEADRQLLLRTLAELPPTYRDIIVLREMENLSYAEIAEVVGLPIGTVMSRLSRGRAQLRKALLHWIARNEPDAV